MQNRSSIYALTLFFLLTQTPKILPWGSRDFFQAIKKGDLNAVKNYTKTEGKNTVFMNSHFPGNLFFYNLNPIHVASLCGHLDIVKYLIEEENVDVNKRDGGIEQSAVYYASLEKDLGVLRYLVEEKKAKIDIVDVIDKRSALHAATQRGHRKIVEYLTSLGLDINQKTKQLGRTALHLAAESGHIDVVQYLLKNHANIDETDADGTTALHLGIESGNLEVVRFLVKRGADVSLKDRYSRTPLYYASKKETMEILQHLLENGATLPESGTDTAGVDKDTKNYLEKILMIDKFFCDGSFDLTKIDSIFQKTETNSENRENYKVGINKDKDLIFLLLRRYVCAVNKAREEKQAIHNYFKLCTRLWKKAKANIHLKKAIVDALNEGKELEQHKYVDYIMREVKNSRIDSTKAQEILKLLTQYKHKNYFRNNLSDQLIKNCKSNPIKKDICVICLS